MKDRKNDLGVKIRTLRELKGISQDAIARCLGISQQAFQKIETGKTKLDFERVSLIAVELNIELETLINFNPDNFLLQNANTAKDLARNRITKEDFINSLKIIISENNFQIKQRKIYLEKNLF
ncbi:MAG: hypothetical protein A3F72_04980 [Bacteroidetes bacterium RIFCSPLOWO2_12_FULL_35_15]|nr:MAG: hypothetical protein A3F72_04980 [Bacteroidetes bacterium RIFCSPLOWO2_12_FULL_35_15]